MPSLPRRKSHFSSAGTRNTKRELAPGVDPCVPNPQMTLLESECFSVVSQTDGSWRSNLIHLIFFQRTTATARGQRTAGETRA